MIKPDLVKRRWAILFFILAGVLAAVSVYTARHQLKILTQWRPTAGTLVRRELLRNHDAEGILFFQTGATFNYLADGKPQSSSAVSTFGSREIGRMTEITLAYKPQSQYALRYDPSHPEVFEFGASWNPTYLEESASWLSLSLGFLLAGILVNWSRPQLLHCLECKQAVKSFFRYCPECGASVPRQ